jgi:chemotaxis protein CheC
MKTAIGRELGNLLRRGEDALLRHDYERASAYFRRAYTAEPGNVTAITNLGFAYAKMGRFTHAQKCFITALDIDPDNQVARKNLSLLMSPEKSGRNPGTQSPCKGSSGEELFLRYLEWGNLQMEQKNYYAAIQYFRQASKIHPDFIEPYLKVGLCFEELREYGAAVGAFTDALDIFPKDPVALEHLNICRGLSGTEDERDNQGLDLFEERTAQPSPATLSTPVRSEQVPPSGRQDSHHPAPASQGAPQVPHSPPVSSPSVPQTEDEIIQSILNQYSTLVGADSAKKDASEVPSEPPEKSSAPAVSQPSPQTQASPGSSDDIVNSILMQYQEDIADGEDQKTQTESADTHENVPHTGSAPLSGENSDMTKAQKIGIRVELSDDQKDALRELGNIGASHAATTLSTMLNTPIMLNVPEISITDFEHINDLISQENSAMGIFTMEGQMAKAGYVILHVPQESVIQMTSIMLGMPVDANRPLNEMDESAITEIGNIMVSAFLDGTAELLGIIMLPSPPRTIFDTPKNVFDLIIKESNIAYDNVVFFRTELICDEHELNLNIFMLPNPPVLQEIVRMLEKIIEDSALGQ